jgi:VWFA-related protein
MLRVRLGSLRRQAVLAGILGLSLTLGAQQQPTFRAGVDLITIETQVVDDAGNPVRGLRPEQFQVSINGRRRPVAFAQFVELTTAAARVAPAEPGVTASAGAQGAAGAAAPDADGRIYMLAVDVNSFTLAESRGVVAAAQGFVRRLGPEDRIGLYVFPVGPWRVPTPDRAEIIRLIDTIIGGKQLLQSQYHLSPSEVVDIMAEMATARSAGVGRGGGVTAAVMATDTATLRRVQLRECGNADVRCVEAIQLEAQSLAFIMEGQLAESAGGLQNVVAHMAEYPGRKTLVVLSGGMASSDRPGGRPDIGELSKALGQTAARSNVSVYALHIDGTSATTMSPEFRRNREPVSRGRDYFLAGRLLDQFAGAAGGTLLPVLIGSGERALERVLRETSSHYVLGVEPADADRNGRLHQLTVRVNARDVSVRSRMWVVVPAR